MTISSRIKAADKAFAPVAHFYFKSRYGERRFEPGISDFTFGNPHEMPLGGIVSAIRDRAVPHDKNWFAYKTSEEEPQAFLAERARARSSASPSSRRDIALTAGAFAAIMVAFRLVLDAGDEAIFSEPAWFCYEPMLLAADAVPRKVALKPPSFRSRPRRDRGGHRPAHAAGHRQHAAQPDRPHLWPRAKLEALADLLERASARIGHRIFLLSDEPYRRLRFDGRGFVSPAAVYPWTLIAYSYGKVLLAPGQRLGYLAISPLMPAEPIARRSATRCFRRRWRSAGASPTPSMQYAVPDLETLSIDHGRADPPARHADGGSRRRRLQRARRRRAPSTSGAAGRKAILSGCGTRSPTADVFVMPGAIMNAPDHFRICLTASDEMVERALPAFAEATGV